MRNRGECPRITRLFWWTDSERGTGSTMGVLRADAGYASGRGKCVRMAAVREGPFVTGQTIAVDGRSW